MSAPFTDSMHASGVFILWFSLCVRKTLLPISAILSYSLDFQNFIIVQIFAIWPNGVDRKFPAIVEQTSVSYMWCRKKREKVKEKRKPAHRNIRKKL